MEPRIQYAKANDGVNIAYCSIGEGPALVATSPAMFSNISLELRVPDIAHWYERLATNRRLVRFDFRGAGMSQRDIRDYSPEALTSDIDAVVDSLELEQVDLLGISAPGQGVVAYAARHPARVRRLILWGVPTNNRNISGERLQAIMSLADRDWVLFSETLAHSLVGWSRGAMGHNWAAFIRASIHKSDYLGGGERSGYY